MYKFYICLISSPSYSSDVYSKLCPTQRKL